MQMRILIIPLLVTLFSSHVASRKLSAADEKKLDDFINEAMKCQHYTGLSVSVVREGEAVYTKGFGYAVFDDEDSSKHVNFTADTILPMASVSKHFTASLIGMVLQNTSYDWDTPYRQMMKELFNEDFYFNGIWRTNRTTLRDLLSHRMGTSGQEVLLAIDRWTKPELMERVRFLNPTAPFRSSYFYNNIMYSVASYIAERHAGKEWDELLRDNFFNKLGMYNTSTIRLGNDTNYSGWAKPHVNLGEGNDTQFDNILGPFPMWLFSSVGNAAAAAGGIATSAKDMAKWMNFQLDYEKYPEILNPNITDDIRVPVQTRQNNILPRGSEPGKDFMDTQEISYAMGITNGFWRGYEQLAHDGSIVLWTSHMTMLPAKKIGVYLASNQPAFFLNDLRKYIEDVLLGVDEPWMNITRFCNLGLENVSLPLKQPSGHDEDFGMRAGIETMLRTLKPESLVKAHRKMEGRDLNRFKSNKNGYALAKVIKDLPVQKGERKTREMNDKLKNYTGTFGQFAYGNCTVDIYPDDGDHFLIAGDLMITYGWIELTLTKEENQEHTFELSVWNLYEPTQDKVVFWSSKNNSVFDRMDMSLDPADKPYTWSRDLKWADAPPPETHECTPPPPPKTCPTMKPSGSEINKPTTGLVLLVLVFCTWFHSQTIV
ncbi:unnamed protein product [Owenia fusiformis]|uniref:Uncharacterized protein n=1 Tax=Owenia fusiformis TaxID=6347 RepID=A0A8J1TDJ4_OWEFU|nr:unnamed protein product [Owenia fusiformis]